MKCNVCGDVAPLTGHWAGLSTDDDDGRSEICPECKEVLLRVGGHLIKCRTVGAPKRPTLLEAVTQVLVDATVYKEE